MKPKKHPDTSSRRRPRTKVLLLETQLPARFSSLSRQQIPFMQELFRNFRGLELVPKQVHSRADLKKFLDYARRDRTIAAVHIVSHGEYSTRRPVIVLTGNERINLAAPEGRALFRNLKAEVIFFSCCELGRHEDLMRNLLRVSGADAIFSYTDTVRDYQAFMAESLFYNLAYGYVHGRESTLTLVGVYERLKVILHFLAIDKNRDSLTHPLLVADFADDLKQ